MNGVTAYVFAHLSMECRRAFGRGTLEVYQDGHGGFANQQQSGLASGRFPGRIPVKLGNGYRMDNEWPRAYPGEIS